MPRFKPGNREQGMMIPVSYDKQITFGTFEHTIDYLMDKRIDTEIFNARYKSECKRIEEVHIKDESKSQHTMDIVLHST